MKIQCYYSMSIIFFFFIGLLFGGEGVHHLLVTVGTTYSGALLHNSIIRYLMYIHRFFKKCLYQNCVNKLSYPILNVFHEEFAKKWFFFRVHKKKKSQVMQLFFSFNKRDTGLPNTIYDILYHYISFACSSGVKYFIN